MITKSDWYTECLQCPDCSSSLDINDVIHCRSCDYELPNSETPSLKPKNPASLSVVLPRLISEHPIELLRTIKLDPPSITYHGPAATRDSSELMSEIKMHLTNNASLLDLGCGPADQAVPVNYLGHKYVGVDYSNSKADMLADAHSLPFKDASFDCVLSYAVLEHLHNPFIAVTEIERVLKPGGIYIGTVSQGEPFHDSYFHHTAWGLLSLVISISNLQVSRLWTSGDTLGSLSRMGRYPKLIKRLIQLIHAIHINFPWLAPRKMQWSKDERILDDLYRAGSICFVFKKPI